MADTYSFKDATGSTLTAASDDIGGVHYARVKLTQGADGAATDVSSAAPLQVTLANTGSNTTAVKVDGSAVTQPVSDGGSTISIDDGAGSITIDGSVSVSGTVAVTDNASSLTVDNAGTFVVQENGAALTALQTLDNPVVVDDAAFTPATTSVMMAGATFDDVAPDSVNEGDAGALRMSANRNLYVNIRDNAGNERGLNIDASGQLAVTLASSQTLGTLTTLTGGGIAHDGVDSGNPIKVGAKAVSALSTATMVAAADRADATADIDGALITRPQFPLGDLLSERVSDTGGTSTAFSTFGATASTRNYVTAISVYNSSATGGYVDFRDGTAGSILYTVALPAGGGAVISGNLPLFRTTANTALAYDVSGALTTVYISISGFKSKT